MTQHASAVRGLRRVFYEGFSVHDIAEPLVSIDATSPADEIRQFMEARAFEVVGARSEGLVVGYLAKPDLTSGPCSQFVHAFDEAEVLDDTSSLAEVVGKLNGTARVFLTFLGQVGGIVTRSDLQKPPMRMWLFGMVSLIEMRMVRLIEQQCLDEQWRAYLSDARIAKAQQLLTERTRRNQNLGLLDCLQFSDKGQIIARNPAIRQTTRFGSRRQVETVVKQLERLRNNLAHSQDIISTDWETIVMLAADLDNILSPRFAADGA